MAAVRIAGWRGAKCARSGRAHASHAQQQARTAAGSGGGSASTQAAGSGGAASAGALRRFARAVAVAHVTAAGMPRAR